MYNSTDSSHNFPSTADNIHFVVKSSTSKTNNKVTGEFSFKGSKGEESIILRKYNDNNDIEICTHTLMQTLAELSTM